MPWTCTKCNTAVADDDASCPRCEHDKTSWTIGKEQTRAFTVSSKGFKCLRAVAGADPLPQGSGAYAQALWNPAKSAPVMPLADAWKLADAAQLPAPVDVLVVRVTPGPADDLSVKLTAQFDRREVQELSFAHGKQELAGEHLDVRFLFCLGEDARGLPSFPGVHVVDVTDGGGGVAPALEVKALKKRALHLALEG